MNPTINPLSFQSMRIGTKAEQQAFLNILAISLKEILSVISPLTQPGGILGNQILVASEATLSSINTTINCANFDRFSVNSFLTVASTLTLNNVGRCVPVIIRMSNSTAGALVFKLSMTNPAGVAYNVRGKFPGSGVAETDLAATGISVAANATQYIWGQTNSNLDTFMAALV